MSDETLGGNAQSILRSLVERTERVEKLRKQLSEDRKAIMQEAKVAGFKPPYIAYLVKERSKPPEQRAREQANIATYEHAVGLGNEPALYKQLQAAAEDAASSGKLVDLFKLLAPQRGDFIMRVGDKPMRFWRDKDGNAQAEPWNEPKRGAAEPSITVGTPQPPAPDCDNDGAYTLGGQAYRENKPITANPFPYGDERVPHWDRGWRDESGSDGMGSGGR